MSTNDSSLTEAVSGMPQTVETNTESESPAYIDTLVGEGRKYADAEGLAKAYANASVHIEELKTKLDSRDTEDSAMAEVLTLLRSNNTTEDIPIVPDDTAAHVLEQAPSVDIKAEVGVALKEIQQDSLHATNTQTAIKTLVDTHGVKKVQDTISDMIAENPANQEIIDTLGRESPDYLVTLLNSRITPTTETPNTPGDGGRPGSRIATKAYELTWSECKEMKKTDPDQYATMTFRSKMTEMRAKHGSAWFET